ncbi:MAG: hypothetical protein ACXW4H_05380 [Candidatus Limnocylindrales bacterium]
MLAIAQHDDREARRGALGAGAVMVVAYRRMFEDGPGQLGAWLAVARPVESAS